METQRQNSSENPWFFLAKSAATILALGTLIEFVDVGARGARKRAKRANGDNTRCTECGNDELGLIAAHRFSGVHDPAEIDIICPVCEAKRHLDAALGGDSNNLDSGQNYHAARSQAGPFKNNKEARGWFAYFLGRKTRRLFDD